MQQNQVAIVDQSVPSTPKTIKTTLDFNKNNNNNNYYDYNNEPLPKTNEIEINELKSKFVHGLIKIQDTNGLIINPDGNYYMNFKYDRYDGSEPDKNLSEQLRNVPKFMSTVWNLKSPQIIIPIITGVTNFKNWKNQKLEEKFRRGLIKAANKTEMW
jgi:hypothetical protein